MNPAERLAAIFDGWRVENQARPYEIRGGDREDAGLTTWREQAAIVEVVRQVEQALDGLDASGDDITPFQPYVTAWYQGAFSATHGFHNNTPAHAAVDEFALQALRMLGVLLNRVAPDRALPKGDRESLAALLEETYALAIDTLELAEPDKIAIAGLVRAAQHVLGRLDFAGPGDLHARISQLSLELVYQAQRLPEDDPETDAPGPKAQLRSLATRLSVFVCGSAAGGFLVELGAEAAKGITGG